MVYFNTIGLKLSAVKSFPRQLTDGLGFRGELFRFGNHRLVDGFGDGFQHISENPLMNRIPGNPTP